METDAPHGDLHDDDDGISEDVAIIIDNGSGVCKAGLSTDDKPTAVFPSVVGMPREAYRNSIDGDIFFGDDVLPFGDNVSPEVLDRCSKLSVHYPLENGIIENFDHMERLWEYAILDKLNVNPHRQRDLTGPGAPTDMAKHREYRRLAQSGGWRNRQEIHHRVRSKVGTLELCWASPRPIGGDA